MRGIDGEVEEADDLGSFYWIFDFFNQKILIV